MSPPAMRWVMAENERVAEEAVDCEDMLQDEALLHVLKEEGSRVKFVFSKTTS